MLWLSIVVDKACTQIWDAWDSGKPVASLRVSPAVYDAVSACRSSPITGWAPTIPSSAEIAR